MYLLLTDHEAHIHVRLDASKTVHRWSHNVQSAVRKHICKSHISGIKWKCQVHTKWLFNCLQNYKDGKFSPRTFDNLVNGLSELHLFGKKVVGLNVAVVKLDHLACDFRIRIDQHEWRTWRSSCSGKSWSYIEETNAHAQLATATPTVDWKKTTWAKTSMYEQKKPCTRTNNTNTRDNTNIRDNTNTRDNNTNTWQQ